jgi:hypothetical protein
VVTFRRFEGITYRSTAHKLAFCLDRAFLSLAVIVFLKL